jgi:hypothetical protein
MYQNVHGEIPDQHVPRKNLVHTSMYEDKPGTYWYIPVCSKMEDVHDDEIRTKDLMHTILLDIPLCYQSEVIGDMNG